ncbi:glycoside hydrolase [Apodospora peruviana]|uniref:Glycoside hydrolase n=1 Tax=Apodospora peruviana TaxID=516989 RepID=A0AAE0ITA4_9PEZI|nr:glycoside hydrolase [Apodospora peruviana]
MKLIFALAAAASMCLLPAQAAKEVFAHYIVGNSADFSVADWEEDIQLAQDVSIDAFVLNVGSQDTNNAASLPKVFEAANNKNFKLFFSFDYAAMGPWPKDQVIALMKQFGSDPAYFAEPETGKPFVSTFEGPGNAGDWPTIKAATNCFFVPDWTSLPPADAASAAGGVADGLFSFIAWPNGDANMTTDSDKLFQTVLQPEQKKYMMPVSPWFYTALPGLSFPKNWLWRGDSLWDLRWQQVVEVQPDFVEILTWNDFGESHYIGPVRKTPAKQLLSAGGAPVDYVTNNPHDGWRKHLAFYISQYKNGGGSAAASAAAVGNSSVRVPVNAAAAAPVVKEESAVVYYRTNPATACGTGGTLGNNADFGQSETAPENLVQDNVFFTALLNSPADVAVTIGGKAQTSAFTKTPAGGGAGTYEGNVGFAGNVGDVVVTVTRKGTPVVEVKGGPPISKNCAVENWNAVAISAP